MEKVVMVLHYKYGNVSTTNTLVIYSVISGNILGLYYR